MRWNVYIAHVGFVEGKGAKLRPVIVISEPVGAHRIVIVAPIYSARSAPCLVGDVSVNTEQTIMGLIKPSTIKLHRMVALPAHDLKAQLGQAPLGIQKSLKEGLRELFEL